jgi:hypothetical protein
MLSENFFNITLLPYSIALIIKGTSTAAETKEIIITKIKSGILNAA